MMEEHVTSLRSGRSAAKAIVGCLALSLIPAACALAAAEQPRLERSWLVRAEL